MNPTHLRELVVRPAIEALDMWSQEAEDLVMETASVESDLTNLKQLGDGPALGLWQCEPETHNDIWANYLAFRPSLSSKIAPTNHGPDRLVWDLRYAAMICRVHYFRVPNPIPETVEERGAYHKKHYNTVKGKATIEEYIQKAQRVKV